ncbi:MAG: type II toxin-antitoxin system prevent-host-death family antitoxin [Deltaproteobacteria bacterium]|jgi:antitoxin YefM|nr:type II toxin-antitoxin system prevent-host-death family antitoxin [Deltaproteobacteria bacterium]
MQAITYTQARQSLAQTMSEVCDGHEPIIITRQKAPAVVMLSLEDYNSIRETAYLLSNPANAERLLQSVANAEAGKVTRVSLHDLGKL